MRWWSIRTMRIRCMWRLDTGVYVTTQVAIVRDGDLLERDGDGVAECSGDVSLAAASEYVDGRWAHGDAAGGDVWARVVADAAAVGGFRAAAGDDGGRRRALTFAAQTVSTQSAAQTMTVTSNGNAPLTVGSVSVTGDFVESDTCAGQTVAVGATCAVQVRFAPTATGARAGVLTVLWECGGRAGDGALTGTGTPAAAVVLTPGSLTFAATTGESDERRRRLLRSRIRAERLLRCRRRW